jgi:tetratricopeptide (TPR) repeat protein
MKKKMKNIILLFFMFSFLELVCTITYGQDLDKNQSENNVEMEVADNIKTSFPNPMVAPSKNEQAMSVYNIGTQFLKENKLDDAERYLKQAINLDPLFVDAMDHLGMVYRRLRRYTEAEEIYLNSIAINENNTVPYQNLAIIYRLQNKLNEAFEQYKKIMEIDIENPESYYGIGELYYMVGDYEKSIPFFDEAIKKYIGINSDFVYDALYNQGLNYYQLKRYDTALYFFNEIMKVDSNNEQLKNLVEEIKNIRNEM